MAKLLTIVGATGTQGSSVVDAMLSLKPEWSLRALTRNPESEAAQNLHSKGVQIVGADLDDAASLEAAFRDTHAIFAVTDFFAPFAQTGLDIETSKEIEWTRCLNIINAASKTDALEHFIWSTLPPAARNSRDRAAGAFHIAHFESKNRADDRIRSMPELLAKTTFVWVGWYAGNFQYPIFKPAFMETANTHIFTAPVGPGTVINTIGDARANLGTFVRAALQQPSLTMGGRVVSAVTAQMTLGGWLEMWERATGKSVVFLKISQEDYERLWGGFGVVEGANLRYYEEYGQSAWSSAGDALLSVAELGLGDERFVGVDDCLRAMYAKSSTIE